MLTMISHQQASNFLQHVMGTIFIPALQVKFSVCENNLNNFMWSILRESYSRTEIMNSITK